MKLKRARLADDLNEKIALRPGPLELVEKNIIPVDSAVKEAIKGSRTNGILLSVLWDLSSWGPGCEGLSLNKSHAIGHFPRMFPITRGPGSKEEIPTHSPSKVS